MCIFTFKQEVLCSNTRRTPLPPQAGESFGAVLPLRWTPPTTPVDRVGELDVVTFKRAEAETRVRVPRGRLHLQVPNEPGSLADNAEESTARKEAGARATESDEKDRGSVACDRDGMSGSFKRRTSSFCTNVFARDKEAASASFKGSFKRNKSVFVPDERLVGLHVTKGNLKKGETKVIYSNQYYVTKNLDRDEDKGKVRLSANITSLCTHHPFASTHCLPSACMACM